MLHRNISYLLLPSFLWTINTQSLIPKKDYPVKCNNVDLKNEIHHLVVEAVEDIMSRYISNVRDMKTNLTVLRQTFSKKLQRLEWEIKGIQIAVITKYFQGTRHYKDCGTILKWNAWTKEKDMLYTIYPDGKTPKKAFCDMSTDGGGWTVLQKRNDASTDFNQNWNAYKEGFGNPKNEYWIGNDIIHQLTKNGDQTLRIDVEYFKGRGGFAKYSTFSILNESQKYKLHIGGYSGTIGDSMMADLIGMVFATVDNDNGKYEDDCARTIGGGGGWWYNWCTYANLNAPYRLQPINNKTGNIYWYTFNKYNSLKRVQIMIKKKV